MITNVQGIISKLLNTSAVIQMADEFIKADAVKTKLTISKC